MKKYLLPIVFSVALVSCKNENKDEIAVEETPELSMQVANTSGLESWNDVNMVEFTFNVERNGETMASREWDWNPKSDQVTLNSNDETITYNRKQVNDSLAMSADRAFVNDVYWLLPQFKLAWDNGKEISYPESSEGKMVKVQYTGNDGYTPGDRYDMVIDENMMIDKWMYYPKGATEPAMTTSFEDYKDYEGIKIATNHRSKDGTLNIYFSDINISKE
ncbi:hypothetical protein SAMN05192588_1902 [Nonlabens sp. Hel1_33_55]|uniref:hypothetical protein n=1 Tax=Nonlabens sp. Hel1_33_55 TaxID=1336802 RepID=UPI000875E0D6|nr:hypothetical protein [Nonlabens sp. Hel1_33_55]SCY25537.1 hypothetical protein SAMN05192588_1902 [Nonlabens sp. Hel1_33_55]